MGSGNIHIDFKPTIHVDNSPQFHNIHGISKSDLESLKQLIEQLGDDKRTALKAEIVAIEPPKNESEKLSAVKRIYNWLNENAEDIVLEVVSAAYFDVIKKLLGMG